MVDASGTTKYQYDSLGRVTNVGETRGALTFNQSYTYDLAGNLATLTMPSGRVVTYTRNANGLVSNVAAPINGTATNLASSITYPASLMQAERETRDLVIKRRPKYPTPDALDSLYDGAFQCVADRLYVTTRL